MTKVFSAIHELGGIREIKKSSYWQQKFLYPFLFQDHLYGIVYNSFVNESEYVRNTTIHGLTYGFDFVMLKRLIKKLHQSESLSILFDELTNQSQFVREILMIASNPIFQPRIRDPAGRRNEWNGYQSIHSVFPFIEDRIHNPSNYLDITIPHCVHPEILIRICRKHILDISFLHLLRLILHTSNNFRLPNSSNRVINLFYRFLWNFCTQSIEYCLIHLWKQIYNFQCTPFWFLFEKTELIRKIQSVLKKSNPRLDRTISRKNCLIHYVRSKNHLILVIDGEVFFESIKDWKILFIIFWSKYFHSWLDPCRISVKNLSNNPLSILGYILHTKNDLIKIRIRFFDFSIDTSLVIRGFCGIIPIIFLIRSLAKEGFCNTSGRPICKLSWTTLTDNEIIYRFDRIMRNIFYYYSGCCKKKGLYQLQYIFRFSCAKTLACRHKSTIRTVWKRYGSNFARNFVVLEGAKSIPSNSWRRESNGKRFWCLTITQTNFLADLLRKSKNIYSVR
nr:maturase K [Aneura pinguis]